jgi:hypothetical protein
MAAIKKLFNAYFFLIIAGIAIVELFSFAGDFFSDIERTAFSLIVLTALILTLRNLKYGVWLILLELFIGSQGYLLYFDFGSFKLSLRIALWLIVLSVWFKNYIFSLLDKEKKQPSIFSNSKIFSQGNFSYFLILFLFIILGGAIGYFNGNDWQNVFFDANGWLYFLLIFPFYEAFFSPAIAGANPFLPIWRLLAAGVAWISLKTFLLFFFFTHAFPENNPLHWLLTHQLYQWVRDTLIGEITLMPSGFARIFIQSQIYIGIAFFLGLFAVNRYWLEIKTSWRSITLIIIAGAIMFGAIITSLSRSFWLGIAIVFIFYVWLTIKNLGWKKFFSIILVITASFVLALALIFATAKFPIPKPSIDFDFTQALTSRADANSNDAAASSRYSLLPLLWQKISGSPLWGSGFGTTVTYNAKDPRVTSQSAGGIGTHTTYAFEWGWLDVWLKIGLLGLLAYLLLFGKIIKDAWKKNTWLAWGLSAGLLLIIIVSVLSPYTNHPLGIGYLLLAAAVIYREQNGSCACA